MQAYLNIPKNRLIILISRCFSTSPNLSATPTNLSNDASTTKLDISSIHQSQTASLSNNLIKVTKFDEYLGEVTKIDAHLNTTNVPHRAFSLFVFDKQNRLLLQQRSDTKITFPGYWTNTCCSHPLNNAQEKEDRWFRGVKLAAKKRVKFEVGIRLFGLTGIFPVKKIYYQAKYNEMWGENEVDYVLFARFPGKSKTEANMKFNKNEIKAVKWIEKEKIKAFLKEKEDMGEKTTPWMKMILDYKLLEWWEAFEKDQLRLDHFKEVIDLTPSV